MLKIIGKLDKIEINNQCYIMKDKKEKKIKVVRLEPSGEEKAFIYQQAMELSPLLSQNNPITVILEKNENEQNITYSVTFILIPDTLNIKIQSKGDNLFEVCIKAKNKAKKTITQLMNQTNTPLRKIHIEHLKQFPYLQ